MPAFDAVPNGQSSTHHGLCPASERLRFPPVTREQIINCSYDKWFPKYRSWCLKSKILPIPAEFLAYIREDGILLGDDDGIDEDDQEWEPTSTNYTAPGRIERLETSDSDSDSEPETEPPIPPNRRFPEFHKLLQDAIKSLGGSVAPKLNWSAPKDAAWISSHNTMKCTTPNDIYLLLKSSNFINHDLEHAFDGCAASSQLTPCPPILVLRQFLPIQPSLEFRCFVKHRTLVGISQRDLGYFSFLDKLKDIIQARVEKFFEEELRFSFPDQSFVFDVYLPEDRNAQRSLGALRLVDINPWAPQTDTLLFGWHELLEMRVPRPILGSVTRDAEPLTEESSAGETTDEDDEDEFEAEFRLVENDDQAAYNFSSGQYSAHKLPREVVDASRAGEGGMLEFLTAWNEATGGMGGTMWQQQAGRS